MCGSGRLSGDWRPWTTVFHQVDGGGSRFRGISLHGDQPRWFQNVTTSRPGTPNALLAISDEGVLAVGRDAPASRCRGRHGELTGPGRHTDRMTSSFDQLADSVLDGKPATEDDALAVLQAHDDELLDVVAAAGRLRREHFGTTVKVNYLVNLKSGLCPENCNYCSPGARLDRRHPQVQVAQHRRGAGAGRRRSPGRRHPGLHGLQRPRPDQQGRRAGRRHGRHHQVRAPRGRDLRLPGAAQGRPGRAAARGRRRRLQPQHQHRRVPPRPDRADPHVRRPRRHRREGQDRRALAVQRPDRRARRDRRAAGRGAVRAQGARLRLDPGQLPDALRRHAATRTPGSSRRCAA